MDLKLKITNSDKVQKECIKAFSALAYFQIVRRKYSISSKCLLWTCTKNWCTLISSTHLTTPPQIAYTLLKSHDFLLKVMFIIIKYFIGKTASEYNEGVKSAFPQLFWEQLESLHQSHKHCGNAHFHKHSWNGILWQIMHIA